MVEKIIALPIKLEQAIAALLAKQSVSLERVEALHTRYQDRSKAVDEFFIETEGDVLAYLALRFPATYAQIYGACRQIAELLSNWKPESLLDIGAGPVTGTFAASQIWPFIQSVTNIEVNGQMVRCGKQLLANTQLDVKTEWLHQDIRSGLSLTDKFDLVIIANILNELAPEEREKLIQQAWSVCTGVLLLIEPGTALGNDLIQETARAFAQTDSILAPYIASSFVPSNTYWLHFPQRFFRPEFQRRVRQHLRSSSEMASDWEEAKYSYVALSKIKSQQTYWGRCVGPVKKYKGYQEVPILTKEDITMVKVLKRHKLQYNFAKKLRWGKQISNKKEIFPEE